MSNIKHWIQTYRGQKFFPLDADPGAVDILDIARALSMLCRYVGHVDRFYSVAEHCVRVSWKLEDRGFGLETQRWGLLHDASEAYLGDVSRPVKHQAQLGGYRDAEARLQTVIAVAFDLRPTEPPEVTAMDSEILGTEAFYLKSPIHPDWHKTTATGRLDAPWKLGWFDRLGWSPAKAEREFLSRFRFLWRFSMPGRYL
jgi:hypothetical protein